MSNFPDAIGFDVETWGEIGEYALQPFRALSGKAGISAASFARGEAVTGLLKPKAASISSILSKATAKGIYIVGWNVSFDAAWCISTGCEAEVMAAKWLDGMLLWKHWLVEPEGDDIPKTKRKSFALEAALKEFFPEQAGFKEFDDFQATDEESLKRLLDRNKGDALFTLKLAELFWSHLNDRQQTAALIEARSIPMVAKTKVIGIRSCSERAQILSDRLEKEADEQLETLTMLSPEAAGVNFGSPPQLRTLLFETWGLPPQGETKTGSLSTDKFALFDLAPLDPRAKMLKDLREAKNNRTKYPEATLKSLEYNGDGCVRPAAKIFGTYTSRMTYSSQDKVARIIEKTTKAKGLHTIEKNTMIPVGVALHQWKRGRDYRNLIRAPEGYTLTEFDFAGQEFRWMAEASKDETMLSLCAEGEDAHSFMGSQVAGVDYRELIALVRADDAQANSDRKCGKFCIAEGELVLTQEGLIPIEKISLAHLVWDGIEWVAHEGLIYQGTKEVMTYDGLTATPDHIVYTQEGLRCCLAEAGASSYCLTRTGHGRQTVYALDNPLNSNFSFRGQAEYHDSMPLQMRNRKMGEQDQSGKREVNSVQSLSAEGVAQEEGPCSYQRGRDVESSEEVQRNETAMPEPQRSVVQELRGERDRVQICECCGSNYICADNATSCNLLELGFRQDRKQRALRGREHQASKPIRESYEQTHKSQHAMEREEYSKEACIPCASNALPSCDVCGANCVESCVQRAHYGRDSGEMGKAKLQAKRVYDLANAGPRHRFTVSGRLVANCNLSYQYRVSAKTATKKARVEYGLEVDEAFIQQTQNVYQAAYPGVAKYWKHQIMNCRQNRYAETYAGRRVQLPGSWAGKEKWPNESTAINYPIQGTGGDQKYLAMAVARNHIQKFGGIFYFELHDGLFFIFPNDKVDAAVPYFRNLLSNLPYKQAWGVDLSIKFPVDSKKGPSWGELEEVF